MPRRNNIAAILTLACVAFTAPSARAEKPAQVKMVFCVPASSGWSLQRFKPLIDPRAKTVFAEMSLAGPQLIEFKLRRFSERAETSFDYKFDAVGRLNALLGSVTVFGAWVGKANLTPDAGGNLSPYHVKYWRDDQPIPKPDDAADYVESLNSVPIYLTIQALPCAAMLKQAEKMNATQE
jgi:hypothetical protein